MRLTILLLTAFLVLTPLPANAGEDSDRAAFVAESRALVKSFAGSLKGELQAAIGEGGPSHAIPVCNVRAPEIARELSQAPQWSVGRTSHKLRNPDNAPDVWESAVLIDFLRRAAAGESLSTMEKVELVESDGRRTLRYMKAIPTGEVCLTCHGTDIDPALKAEIKAYYPLDNATGFALGDLRGAFTISKTLAKD